MRVAIGLSPNVQADSRANAMTADEGNKIPFEVVGRAPKRVMSLAVVFNHFKWLKEDGLRKCVITR